MNKVIDNRDPNLGFSKFEDIPDGCMFEIEGLSCVYMKYGSDDLLQSVKLENYGTIVNAIRIAGTTDKGWLYIHRDTEVRALDTELHINGVRVYGGNE